MKIQGEQYETMKAAVQAVVEYYGGAARIKKAAQGATYTAVLWRLWAVASDNLMYDDSHPMFVKEVRERIIPQQPGFDVYADGVNDTHIETALKKIAKEIGL